MRIRTETMEVPSSTTDPRRRSKRPRTEQAHIPTIPTPAGRERQAALHTGPRRAADGASGSPATSLPWSVMTRCRGESTPRTRGQASPRPTKGLRKGWGDSPCNTPPRERGAMAPVPDTGTDHPTNRSPAPRGSPAQLQRGQTARARRAHRNTGSTTRAAQGRTQK